MSHDFTARPAYAGTTAQAPGWRAALKGWSRPTKVLIVLSSTVMIILAIACGWLSYHAQVGYAQAHNGGQVDQARAWAALLDAGTAGVSLLRLHETLRMRPGTEARLSLLGCVALSVTMNLLHAPSQSPGGYLVAAVPPVMYATFLEHLLTTLRSLLVPDEERRSLWRTLALWINFPATMWSTWRNALRREARDGWSAQLTGAVTDRTLPHVGEVERASGTAGAVEPVVCGRRARGLGTKRLAFEAALVAQVRSGDLRLFSGSERARNEAAYEAAASLPAPLSKGAARRYVVQALARVQQARLGEAQSAGQPEQGEV